MKNRERSEKRLDMLRMEYVEAVSKHMQTYANPSMEDLRSATYQRSLTELEKVGAKYRDALGVTAEPVDWSDLVERFGGRRIEFDEEIGPSREMPKSRRA